jgi:hypothetical protein
MPLSKPNCGLVYAELGSWPPSVDIYFRTTWPNEESRKEDPDTKAERIVHLDQGSHPADGPRSSFGHSIGHFEGDTLVIDSVNYSAGVLSQYVEIPAEKIRGLLHSDALTWVERVRFYRESGRLGVMIELEDPRFYTRSFRPVGARYAPSDLSIEPFGCRPENPDHAIIE